MNFDIRQFRTGAVRLWDLDRTSQINLEA